MEYSISVRPKQMYDHSATKFHFSFTSISLQFITRITLPRVHEVDQTLALAHLALDFTSIASTSTAWHAATSPTYSEPANGHNRRPWGAMPWAPP